MNSKKVKIVDTNFAHANFTTDYQVSKHIDWVRGEQVNEDEIVFITDSLMLSASNINGRKIGMLMEPRSINQYIYSMVDNIKDKFETILTYDKELLLNSDKFTFYPHCGCWILPDDHKVWEKSKLVSIVASNKRETIGHRLRHESISVAINKNYDLSVFGRGYNPIDYKLYALRDYAFSLTIENSKFDYYFTEKLIDTFMTGTVPIYWGCPSIGNFFNLDGMIIVDTLEDISRELSQLTMEKYYSMLPAIHDNFNKAKEFLIAEDWIYKNTKIFQ
jgi:hypothetical protein